MILTFKNTAVSLDNATWAVVKMDCIAMDVEGNQIRFVLFPVSGCSTVSPAIDEWYVHHMFQGNEFFRVSRIEYNGVQHVQVVLDTRPRTEN